MMEMVTKRSFASVAADDDEYLDEPDAKLPTQTSPGHKMIMTIVSISFLMVLTSFFTLHISKQINNSQLGGRRQRRWIPNLLTDIDVYPEYKGALAPRGRITIRFEDDESEFLVRFELEGLEKNCENCTIYIHEGRSCDEPILDPYYNVSLYEMNPWTLTTNKPTYKSNDEGKANNAFIMSEVGIGARSMKGHVAVIYSSDQTKIGCGVLQTVFNVNFMQADIGLYVGYTPSIEKKLTIDPSGSVDIMAFEDNVLRITGTLDGLEPNCVKCGIHIHKGLSCGIINGDEISSDNVDSTVGGHWFDQDVNGEDAWKAQKSTYTTDSKGHTKFSYYVYNGYDFEDNIDHALVLHAQDSTRIGCGILKPREIS